ncbi:unnamed protein product, partial [Schistosoma turkestanicum]
SLFFSGQDIQPICETSNYVKKCSNYENSYGICEKHPMYAVSKELDYCSVLT